MRPVVMRLVGATVAIALGFAGARWESQAALATIAALAITVLLIEQRLESRGFGRRM